MKRKSIVTIGLTIGIGLTLMALPLPGICGEAKPEGTLRIARNYLAQEGFLPDYGDTDQNRVWPMVYDCAFFKNEKTRANIPGLALGGKYSKDALSYTMVLRKGVP